MAQECTYSVAKNTIFVDMKERIGLFVALGERLRRFGNNEETQQVIAEACRANAWFMPNEIRRAVGAIADRMLQREALEGWLGAYPVPVAAPRRVLVIMAGNIPAVGFLDLLCVVASGHRCIIKPSSKDSVLIQYIVGQLLEIDPGLPIGFYDGQTAVDAVIATGSNNARRHFQTRYANVPALLRGSRQSVAVLSGRETPGQLAGLADDIGAYSGLGCRSVSRLFVPVGYRLHLKIEPTNPKSHNDYLRSRALLTMNGTPFIDLGGAVAVEQQEFPASLSRIAYSYYRDLQEVETWLAAHDDELQCVVSACVHHSRRTDFGCAQSPSLTDWPDDRDVLEWLTRTIE